MLNHIWALLIIVGIVVAGATVVYDTSVVGEKRITSMKDGKEVVEVINYATPRAKAAAFAEAGNRLTKSAVNSVSFRYTNDKGGESDGAQARTADLVDAPGRSPLRHAGANRCLASRTLSLTGGQHLAQDHLIDIGGVHTRLRQGRANGRLAQLGSRQGRQPPHERADGGAGGGDDDGLGQGLTPRQKVVALLPQESTRVT